MNWITWENDGSIRSRVLSKHLNAKLYEITGFESFPALRYLKALIKTTSIFFKFPKKIIVQNPSVVLAFYSALMKNIFKYKLTIDLHTHYIKPKGISGKVMKLLNNYSLKKANLIVVTNEPYKQQIQNITNKEIIILPDMLPNIQANKTNLKNKSIVYICTFSEDEPYNEVIKAANDVDAHIYITGKPKKHINAPYNVSLTGFLPKENYYTLLNSADAIMVLTNQDNCMLCGAYEAVTLEKPLILSNKKVLTEYFKATFTENDANSIAKAIRKTLNNKTNMKLEAIEAKKNIQNKWQSQWQNLIDKL